MNATKQYFSRSTMARIDACALIFQDENPDIINRIMEARNCEAMEAGRIYTIGILKADKRRGIARNYKEALELLEDRQIAGRHGSLNPANELSRTIAAINKENKGTKTIPDYYRSMDKGKTFIPVYPIAQEGKEEKQSNMGKVFGTLYTEWEAREAETAPDMVLNQEELNHEAEQINKNLKLFFNEYLSNLSNTARARIRELKDRKESAEYMTSRIGRNDAAIKPLVTAADNLLRNFPHNEALTVTEYIDLVRKYA